MRFALAIFFTISVFLIGMGSVEASETAPPPEDGEVVEALDEHWEEELFPDIIQDITDHFESVPLGIPEK